MVKYSSTSNKIQNVADILHLWKPNSLDMKRYAIAVVISFVGILCWMIWGTYYTFIKGVGEGIKWVNLSMFENTKYNAMVGGDGSAAASAASAASAGGSKPTINDIFVDIVNDQKDTIKTSLKSSAALHPLNVLMYIKYILLMVVKFFIDIIRCAINAIADTLFNGPSEVINGMRQRSVDSSQKAFGMRRLVNEKGENIDQNTNMNPSMANILFGPIIMVLVTIFGALWMLFTGLPGLCSFSGVMYDENKNRRWLHDILIRFVCKLGLSIGLGIPVLAWYAITNALKYLFSGLVLFVPGKSNTVNRQRVIKMFKDYTWSTTAALMWISAVCVCPWQMYEMPAMTKGTISMMGFVALVTAVINSVWAGAAEKKYMGG